MTDKQLILDIEDSLFAEDVPLAVKRLAALRDELDSKTSFIDCQLHRYYFGASVRAHGAVGDYDSLKGVAQETLERAGLLLAEGKLNLDKFKTLEGKSLRVIGKLIQTYFDAMLIIGAKADYQKLYTQVVAVGESLAEVRKVMETTDPELKSLEPPKAAPQSLLILEVLVFAETADTVQVKTTLIHPDKVTVQADPDSTSRLLIKCDGSGKTQTLSLSGPIGQVVSQSQEGAALTFTLKKADPKTWDTLVAPQPAPTPDTPPAEPPKKAANPYLSNKNWDKIVAEEEAEAIRAKDYDGTDPAMHFFKEIYANADEDTRRAMMKSYVESDGKALSTNWKEVASKDYKKEFEGRDGKP